MCLPAEKPSLQSRHSLDSAKVQEKEAGPLWITLALQKQKGFREQQQNREERRSLREAKLAEKQSRERDSVRAPHRLFSLPAHIVLPLNLSSISLGYTDEPHGEQRQREHQSFF